MPRRACLTSVRFSMVCDIIKPYDGDPGEPDNWTRTQDPISGAFIQTSAAPQIGAPSGPHIIKDVPLFAESVLDGGIRVAGTTERFGTVYEGVDYVKAVFPKGTPLTRRDRVTNIRAAKSGEVIWREEEIPGTPPTEFNVNGAAPIIFMGSVIELDVLLERAQVQ